MNSNCSACGLRLTGILRPGAANGASSLLVAQHGVVAGTGAREFSAWFQKDFDGDARHAETEQRNGKQD